MSLKFDVSTEVALTHEQVFAIFEANGIVQALVRFRGGGDDGGVDRITLVRSDKEEVDLNEHETYDYCAQQAVSLTRQQVMENALYKALSQPVLDNYYTFAGDYYVYGTFVWNVEHKSVTEVSDFSPDEDEEEYDD